MSTVEVDCSQTVTMAKTLDEALSKQHAGQLAEEIDAMGQESEEKAVKWVQEVEHREEKKRQETDAQHAEQIAKKRRFKKNDYYIALYQYASKLLKEYDIPQGYEVDCYLKEEGKLVFGVRKVGYRWYAKGMIICGEPKYDKNCIERLVYQTMMALDELEGQHERHRTKSGIILPNRKL